MENIWALKVRYIRTAEKTASPKLSLSLRFPHQNPVYDSPFPHTLYMHRPSHSCLLISVIKEFKFNVERNNLVQQNMHVILSNRRSKMGNVSKMQPCRGVAWPQLPWKSNNMSSLYCCEITCSCQKYKVVLSGKCSNGFPFTLLSNYKWFHNQIRRINQAEHNNTCT